jgi:RNA polymerase-binding transcription factor DksA
MTQSQIRRTLLQRQFELTQRLSALEVDLQKSHSHDWSEQAQERENDEVLEAIASRTANELMQIDQVLRKIGGAGYGICVNCGHAIGKERLKVLPETQHCVSCAKLAH